jgi:hypothetical protein
LRSLGSDEEYWLTRNLPAAEDDTANSQGQWDDRFGRIDRGKDTVSTSIDVAIVPELIAGIDIGASDYATAGKSRRVSTFLWTMIAAQEPFGQTKSSDVYSLDASALIKHPSKAP